MVIIYPIYMLCGFPEHGSILQWILIVNEGIYVIDIGLRFFT